MKELIKSISKKEWWLIFSASIVMILITGVPYLFGYLTADFNMIYNGLHSLSPGDFPVYYSYINQVKEGNFLVKDLFTSEVQGGGTFNIWWVAVGLLAEIFNLPIILAFQLSRLLMIPVFIFVAYLFISYFFADKIKRKISLIFLLFSSGIGFFFAGQLNKIDFSGTKTYWWPIDLWLTEANTFNALYQTSHFIVSITLTILIFLLTIIAFEKRKFSYAVVSGILALFYFNFHPYYLPIIFGVLGIHLLILSWQAGTILWRQAGYLITIFLISLPSVIYHFWLVKIDPVVGQRALQNVTLISPPIFLFIGYGFLWLGFILGLFFSLKNKKLNNRLIFLLVWLGLNLALIFSPFPFQSRYTQGLHLVLVIFTVIGLFDFAEYLKIKLKPKAFNFWINNPALLILLFIILFCPSTLYSLFRDFYYFIYKPGEIKIELYLPNDVFTAIKWLGQQPKNQLVLGADIPSKFIPGFSGQTVYSAHAHETLFFYSKVAYLIWFFADNKNNEAKIRFLKKQGIDYVFYSDYEKQLGNFDPADKDYLKLVFSLPQAQIYQVIKN